MQIEKRDGTLVPYDNNKIILAIEKAMNEVDGMIYEHDTAKDIAYEIEKKIKSSTVPVSVEVIQDWVEDYLMRSAFNIILNGDKLKIIQEIGKIFKWQD